MSGTSVITLIFATVLYLINVGIYAIMIRDKQKHKFFANIKLLVATFILYTMLCLVYWGVTTYLYFMNANMSTFISYLISTAYCLWCIYSMTSMIILPIKQQANTNSYRIKKLDYISFIVAIFDAVVFGVIILNYLNYTSISSNINTNIIYGGIIIAALSVLTIILAINIRERAKINHNIKR